MMLDLPDKDKIIKFARDTKMRKQSFTPSHFQHPAKMDAQLLIWIVEKWTSPGEVILDCMAGSGTTMLACQLGRHCILIDLESKFCKMMEDNWAKVRQRGPQMGYQMGDALILQGDARNLTGILADKIISSPPFAGNTGGLNSARNFKYGDDPVGKRMMGGIKGGTGDSANNIDRLPYGNIDKIITSPPHGDAYSIREGGQVNKEYVEKRKEALKKQGKDKLADSLKVEEYASRNPDNLGNLPYGNISQIITSPPYAEAHDTKDLGVGDKERADLRDYSYLKTETEEQIGNLPYGSINAVISSPPYESAQVPPHTKEGEELRLKIAKQRGVSPDKVSYMDYTKKQVDAVISSPPYEGQISDLSDPTAEKRKQRLIIQGYNPKDILGNLTSGEKAHWTSQYSDNKENIGNLKSSSYLEAMLLVYQQCFAVLKPGGLMCLVVKSFIRNKKIVDLASDTIKLCEQAGFVFQDRWYRELTSMSFWRIIYSQKFPEVEPIKYEDILIFSKV